MFVVDLPGEIESSAAERTRNSLLMQRVRSSRTRLAIDSLITTVCEGFENEIGERFSISLDGFSEFDEQAPLKDEFPHLLLLQGEEVIFFVCFQKAKSVGFVAQLLEKTKLLPVKTLDSGSVDFPKVGVRFEFGLNIGERDSSISIFLCGDDVRELLARVHEQVSSAFKPRIFKEIKVASRLRIEFAPATISDLSELTPGARLAFNPISGDDSNVFSVEVVPERLSSFVLFGNLENGISMDKLEVRYE